MTSRAIAMYGPVRYTPHPAAGLVDAASERAGGRTNGRPRGRDRRRHAAHARRVPVFRLLGYYALLVAAASATQDIAIDAMAVRITPQRQLGYVNSIRVTAYRAAMIVAACPFGEVTA